MNTFIYMAGDYITVDIQCSFYKSRIFLHNIFQVITEIFGGFLLIE
jgi:hypothetical protein